jgi:hypothetical protein
MRCSLAALLLLSGGGVCALEPVHGVRARVTAASRSAVPAAVTSDAPPTAKDGYRTPAQLKTGIASFYDGSSALWERVWGEHMHHGYYPVGSKRKDHQKAQEDMIDEVLKWARAPGEPAPIRVLDVGCGIGGSTRHLAREFGSEGRGVTLSPYQARRANEISAAAGMADRLSFQARDGAEGGRGEGAGRRRVGGRGGATMACLVPPQAPSAPPGPASSLACGTSLPPFPPRCPLAQASPPPRYPPLCTGGRCPRHAL